MCKCSTQSNSQKMKWGSSPFSVPVSGCLQTLPNMNTRMDRKLFYHPKQTFEKSHFTPGPFKLSLIKCESKKPKTSGVQHSLGIQMTWVKSLIWSMHVNLTLPPKWACAPATGYSSRLYAYSHKKICFTQFTVFQKEKKPCFIEKFSTSS